MIRSKNPSMQCNTVFFIACDCAVEHVDIGKCSDVQQEDSMSNYKWLRLSNSKQSKENTFEFGMTNKLKQFITHIVIFVQYCLIILQKIIIMIFLNTFACHFLTNKVFKIWSNCHVIVHFVSKKTIFFCCLQNRYMTIAAFCLRVALFQLRSFTTLIATFRILLHKE